MEKVLNTNPPDHKYAHPIAFMFLIMPYGIVSGYITVTLAYVYSRAGIPIDNISIVSAASFLPAICSFLWAPFVDTTLSVKKWHVLATLVSGGSIIATGLLPAKASSLPFLIPVILLASFAATFVNIATNSIMAYDTPEDKKGRAAGFLQAGNLGSAALGGGGALYLAGHLHNFWQSPLITGAICCMSSLMLFFVKEPAVTVRVESIKRSFVNLLKDVWSMILSRAGYMALFLCLLPIGTGAASNLWSPVGIDWHASADTVALVVGLGSGIITALGCMTGGWICDIIDRKMAYIIFGLLQVVCVLAMAFTPHTENMYMLWVSIYAATTGLAYAGYTAFVLEAIGKGAAGTKVSMFTALSNIPIAAMIAFEGYGYKHWHGANGMLYTEAVAGVVAIGLFFLVQAVSSKKALA